MPKRYVIRATTEFSAAHLLRGYPGACERIHGHNFEVTAEVETVDVDNVGMAIDFLELRRATAEITDTLDHRFLNEIPPFTEVNPTAENIAAHVYRQLRLTLPRVPRGSAARLKSVTVRETPHSSVTYSESDSE